MAFTKLIPSPITSKRVLLNEEAIHKMKRAASVRPRVVSFDESKNVAHDNTQWCEEDCVESWYTAEELYNIKMGCYDLARLIHKKEKETEHLDDTYKNVLLRVYDACCAVQASGEKPLVSTNDKLLLMKIVAKSSTRTGLERICIREIAHDRHFRRGEVVDAILDIQQHRHNSSSSERTCAELSRLSSESLSRPSRLFARFMAVALAATIHH
eukprot:scaffold3842_cov158-Amphora_coffeaeformis.AAC.4